MPETARQIIEDAMSLIAIFPDEAALVDTETELIRRTLNRMMNTFEAQGIRLGYTEVSSLTNDVTVPDTAIEGIVSNLAARIAPHFRSDGIPQSVMALAKSGKKDLFNIGVKMYPMDYPGTLPIGSGNSYTAASEWREPYYDVGGIELLILNSGCTVTIATANTPVVIGATWTEKSANYFDVTTAGKCTFTGSVADVGFKAVIYAEVASGTDDCTFYLAKNGVKIQNSGVKASFTAGTSKQIVIQKKIELVVDDYVEIYAENNDATANITINSANLRTI